MENERYRLAVERQRRITELLSERESITTKEICSTLGISPMTARNDLAELELQGKLIRVRGGATIIGQTASIQAPPTRKAINLAAKQTIAQLAAQRVHDGDSVLLDSGTTTLELLKALSSKRTLTIITNDLHLAELSDSILPESTLMLIGGTCRHGHMLTYGSFALAAIESVYADVVFMCPTGFLGNVGCMTDYEASAPVKSSLVQHARRRYLLLDTSKIGRGSFVCFAKLSDFDEVFLEKDPGVQFRDEAEALGVKLTFPVE